jgi:hypothetical protein
MHRENLSIAARRAADSGGGRPPFGSFDWQLRIADWNAGASTDTPLTFNDGPEPARWLCWICRPPPPLLDGSGKFGTPWARMHCAYARKSEALTADTVAREPDEPHAASPRLAAIATSAPPVRPAEVMAEVYESADNTTGTFAVTTA